MDDIFTNLKRSFREGSILTKLTYINVGIFVIVRLIGVISVLFNFYGISIVRYLQMPSALPTLIYKPWTLISYMFTHYDFLHIIFNMLWLYWFGKIFLQLFNGRQLGALYILGGLAGAVTFITAYNTLPYFRPMVEFSSLMGASASVMAIVFAISFYRKDLEINLLFFGRIKLIYLALATLLIDLLAITSNNAGGHLAHIGGALLGIFFATQMKKGKDITRFVAYILDWFANRKKPRAKMHVTYAKREQEYEYNSKKNKKNADIDTILEKLKRSGYESLSAEEKKMLFDASKS